jgi:hypothetical protein
MPCPGPVQPVPIDSTIPQGHTTVADLNEGEITGFKNLSMSSRKYFNGYHKAIPQWRTLTRAKLGYGPPCRGGKKIYNNEPNQKIGTWLLNLAHYFVKVLFFLSFNFLFLLLCFYWF